MGCGRVSVTDSIPIPIPPKEKFRIFKDRDGGWILVYPENEDGWRRAIRFGAHSSAFAIALSFNDLRTTTGELRRERFSRDRPGC